MKSNLPFGLNPDNLFDPIPFGFCHSISAPGNGRLIFISGQRYWPQNQLSASTVIPVPRLALDGMKVEVDATAFKSISDQCAPAVDEEKS
ncbi:MULTISPECIES: hypothetical protein [Vibrio]|uniref:Uncharacterized protein n=1 Tax=Vibrio ostreae TaxID=2841925 RepID=A0A975UAS0_9VIBR|nr:MULTISPECIES: hypothetical protein [Vibrio]QXO18248.1 hypothetical protein KNV97_08165 [Vibrio ostreae]